MANVGLLSSWHEVYVPDELEALRSVLQKGDIVEISARGDYAKSAFSVCTAVGEDPKVAHRFGPPILYKKLRLRWPSCGKLGDVRELPLVDLAGGAYVRINNVRDKVSEPREAEEIVGSALAALGTLKLLFESIIFDNNYNTTRLFAESCRYSAEALDDRLGPDRRSPWLTARDAELFLWLLRQGDIVEFNQQGRDSVWSVCDFQLRFGQPNKAFYRFQPRSGLDTYKELAKDRRFRIDNSWDGRLGHDGRADVLRGRGLLAPDGSWLCCMHIRYSWRATEAAAGCTPWCSAVEELRPLIRAGDIVAIRGRGEGGRPIRDWAVAVGRERLEVAHRRRSGGMAVIARSPLENFLGRAATDREFCIQNQWNEQWQPKSAGDVLETQRDGPCRCDAYNGACPHFVIGARYGNKARVRAQEILSGWCRPEELATLLSEAVREGDILEVAAGAASSFAVYVGGGDAVHPCGSTAAVVPLTELVRDGVVRVNNFWDLGDKPWSGRSVAEKARRAVGTDKYGRTGFDFACRVRYKKKFLRKNKVHIERHRRSFDATRCPTPTFSSFGRK